MIKIIIPGRPITKSNFKLTNINGQSWMPSKGKYSKYLDYEYAIAWEFNAQYKGPVLDEDLITVMKFYFPDKKMGDLHNYPKSICDGLEKSGKIKNDKILKPVLLFNYIDKNNPRVEVELYPISNYKLNYFIDEISPKD